MAAKKINFNKLKEENQNTTELSQLTQAFNNFEDKPETPRKEKTHFEEIDKNEINLDPKNEFQVLFPLNLDVVQDLKNRFDNTGYDKSQCVHTAVLADEPESGEFVIDGHHRLAAALECENIDKIPVYRHKFQTRTEAVIYALELQIKRRNLDKKELFVNYEKLKKLQAMYSGTEAEDITPGKQAAKDAKILGVSTRQVEKMNAIEKSGDEDLKASLKNGDETVGSAYAKLKEKERKEKEEISEALDDNSGDPAAVTISTHKDKYDRPNNKLTREQDLEQTALRKESYELGYKEGFEAGKKETDKISYAEGFEKATVYIISELVRGKTLEEIYNSDVLSDLTPSVLFNLTLPEDAESLFYSLQK